MVAKFFRDTKNQFNKAYCHIDKTAIRSMIN